MARLRTLTWDKAGQRWRRKYKGRYFYGKRGVKKSDENAYRLAGEEYLKWRAEIDKDLDANKPYRREYELALSMRKEMADWCLLEGDTAEHDRITKEMETLNAMFSRTKPPALNRAAGIFVYPLAFKTAQEKILWSDRIDSLKAYQKWTGATEHSKTIAGNLDTYLASRKKEATAGVIKPAYYALMELRLAHFRSFTGGLAVEMLNAHTLTSFVNELDKKDISPSYAHGILTSVKGFVRWLATNEVIEHLPRNIDALQIAVQLAEIVPLTKDEITALTTASNDRTRLYLLLMLNCGFGQQDIADLKHNEVDWVKGRIIRQRSKTRSKKNRPNVKVPKVNYLLWRETFALLKQFKSEHPDLVLINENGSPLRQRGFRADGTTHNLDNVKKAYQRVCDKLGVPCKPLKLLRKTGASKLDEHKDYGRYAQYYLGHAPMSVADSRYVAPSVKQFDNALRWLGKQFGIA